MRAEHVGGERLACVGPRLPDVRRARAVEDGGGPQVGQGPRHGRAVDKIHVTAPPADGGHAAGGQEIDQVAAGETAGAGDKHRSQDFERSRTNGGHFVSRSDSVGEDTGHAMPIRGSFHMNPDS